MSENDPTISELLSNFAGAMVKWVKAGVPIVSKEDYEARLSTCRSCEYWDEQTRLGYGKCNAPDMEINGKKCGCGKGKLVLGTGRCPLVRWDK